MITEQELVEMVSHAGSMRVFWRYLSRERTARPTMSEREAFDELDEAFEEKYHRPWFPSYDAFRRFKSRYHRLIT